MTPKPVVLGLMVVLLSVVFIMATYESGNTEETLESPKNDVKNDDNRPIIDYDNPQRLNTSKRITTVNVGSTHDFNCERINKKRLNETHCY